MLNTIYDRGVRLFGLMKVMIGQATLHWNMPLGELLQYGPPKSLPRDATGRYCPKSHNTREKKLHEVDHSTTNLLSVCPPDRLPPQRSDLLPECLNRKGDSTSPPDGAGTALAAP